MCVSWSSIRPEGSKTPSSSTLFIFLSTGVQRQKQKEQEEKGARSMSHFCRKTDIAFLTSDSKFHNFEVTLPLPSFPDWLTAFNREETVSHVNVLALLSSHRNGADCY